MKLVYVAGPFSAPEPWERERNIVEAERVAFGVVKRALGYFPVCVHSMGRPWWGHIHEARALEGDLEILRRCDAVVLVEGWQYSRGTRGEIAEAKDRQIPCYEGVHRLIEGDATDHDELLAWWDSANEGIPF